MPSRRSCLGRIGLSLQRRRPRSRSQMWQLCRRQVSYAFTKSFEKTASIAGMRRQIATYIILAPEALATKRVLLITGLILRLIGVKGSTFASVFWKTQIETDPAQKYAISILLYEKTTSSTLVPRRLFRGRHQFSSPRLQLLLLNRH